MGKCAASQRQPVGVERQHGPAQQLGTLPSLAALQAKLEHALVGQLIDVDGEGHPGEGARKTSERPRKQADWLHLHGEEKNPFPHVRRKRKFSELLNLLLPVTPDLVAEGQAGADVLREDDVTDPRGSVQQLAGDGEAVVAGENGRDGSLLRSFQVCVRAGGRAGGSAPVDPGGLQLVDGGDVKLEDLGVVVHVALLRLAALLLDAEV